MNDTRCDQLHELSGRSTGAQDLAVGAFLGLVNFAQKAMGRKRMHLVVSQAQGAKGFFAEIAEHEADIVEFGVQRGEKVEMIRAAELDLAEKIADFQANLDVIKSKHSALSAVREGLERFAGKRREEA